MTDLETRFLLLSVEFLEWKHYSLSILELAHEKCSEQDPDQKESFKVFKNKAEEKFDEIGDKFIIKMNSILPYKTKYKSWKEAVRYLDTIRRG